MLGFPFDIQFILHEGKEIKDKSQLHYYDTLINSTMVLKLRLQRGTIGFRNPKGLISYKDVSLSISYKNVVQGKSKAIKQPSFPLGPYIIKKLENMLTLDINN